MEYRTEIARCAALDGGVVSRRRLTAVGVDPRHVDVLRRSGELRQIRRGWYQLGDPQSVVVSTVRAGAVLTCVSALEFRPGVWIPPGRSRLHVRWTEHRRRPSFPHQCRALHPLPTPVRAVDCLPVALQCAANCLPPDLLIAVLDSTLRMTPALRVTDLHDIFYDAPERIVRLLDCVDPLAGSGTESITRFRLQQAGFRVRSQQTIPGVGRVDLLVGDKLIIECDSETFHSGSQRRVDYRRDRVATVGNYRVLRVDYAEVMGDWDGFAQQVSALARKRRHRGRTDF